ncbi:MAG: DUF6259 domain-containing protein [Terriglobia bacterium]
MAKDQSKQTEISLNRRDALKVIGGVPVAALVPVTALSKDTRARETPSRSAELGTSESTVSENSPAIVINPGYRLLIDTEKGTLASFCSTFGVDRELLIPDHARLPLFKVEFMNEHSEFRTVTSLETKQVRVSRAANRGETTITIDFNEIAELPLAAHVTIRCPVRETLTYWNLELNNGTTSWIGHIQFPVVEVPFDSAKTETHSYILWSLLDGMLAGPVGSSMSLGSNSPEVWRRSTYPGGTTAQLMAYYDDAGGLYVACDDAKGLPKFISPLLEKDGVTMGLSHYPATHGPGVTKLPYRVVLGTFHGDWYAAAEIYRNWASRQPFCPPKLAERTDVPKWLAEGPPAIAFPMRGQGDWDPHGVNPEYTPLTNALPYIETLAEELKGPILPITFNWEHAGPWVQPDAFPPLGGEAAFHKFMSEAKARGWHPMIYGDGLCWVIWQKNTNYDGMSYFRSHDGEAAVVRNWDGKLLEGAWPWRKNYMVCVATKPGRQMILNMTKRMTELGPDVVQQFDQGCGPVACYATNHGHPPVPGAWMTEDFETLLEADRATATAIHPGIAMSSEGAPPEVFLKHLQVWDARLFSFCPLYSFLYHEYGNGFEGFYTNRINDEALRASVAKALVNGYFINFTLRDKGLVEYDWDQTWTRAVPDQAAFLDWTRRVTHFRAGLARDYLVYGRMLRPWKVNGVTLRDFGWGKEPAVPSATWQAPDGRVALVLANYACLPENPQVELKGEGSKQLVIHLDDRKEERAVQLPSVIDIKLEPRSLCLIEVR